MQSLLVRAMNGIEGTARLSKESGVFYFCGLAMTPWQAMEGQGADRG
jgi:hypothetical protein